MGEGFWDTSFEIHPSSSEILHPGFWFHTAVAGKRTFWMGNVAATLLKAHSSHTSNASFCQHLRYEVIYLVRIGGLFSWASEFILLKIFLLQDGFFKTHYHRCRTPRLMAAHSQVGEPRSPQPSAGAENYGFFLFVLFFWPCCLARGILVSQTGIEPGPQLWNRSPNHWITREFPRMMFLTTWECHFAVPVPDTATWYTPFERLSVLVIGF